ncbi:STAS domain-containing protein [Cognatazoarcus halotolerans]|uniref:STAS domain-containing protein n=1 Tax=Cognatazoarcus halotolerans TaxID=2686016 RepID=UPI001F458B16|nr:STAS domain-containing protein [Cognatazoarcus halotolerans]
MAISFFGKKPGTDERAKPAAASGKSAPRSELSTLDFSGAGDVGRALAQCADKVEVLEGGDALLAVAEEAAMLFANGNDVEAAAVLDAALDGAVGEEAGEGLWLMLLDLHRLAGERARFDQRSAAYAARFEKSSPSWEDLSVAAPAPAAGVVPCVTLSGSLSGQAAQQFGKLVEFARGNGGVRLDLGRLRGADDLGCQILRKTLAEMKRERIDFELLNCGHLADMLGGQLSCGRRERQESWKLLFDLLQRAGEFDRFEELAIDYAITFEESPPSWEAPSGEQTGDRVKLAAAVRPDSDFMLEGDITANEQGQLRRLAAFAAERAMVDVDCSRLRRVDFVSAGAFFNILATLRAQGKLVVFRHVNNMVAALLRVMGVDQVAQIVTRR